MPVSACVGVVFLCRNAENALVRGCVGLVVSVFVSANWKLRKFQGILRFIGVQISLIYWGMPYYSVCMQMEILCQKHGDVGCMNPGPLRSGGVRYGPRGPGRGRGRRGGHTTPCGGEATGGSPKHSAPAFGPVARHQEPSASLSEHNAHNSGRMCLTYVAEDITHCQREWETAHQHVIARMATEGGAGRNGSPGRERNGTRRSAG